MDQAPENIQRQVVPRWRQIHRTRPEELRSSAPPDMEWQDALRTRQEQEVAVALSRWRDDPTLENASELVDASFMTDHVDIAIGAAHQILADNSSATDAAKDIARCMRFGPTFKGSQDSVVPSDIFDPTRKREKTRYEISAIKKQLKIYPRNPLLYVEAARHYSTLAQHKNAKEATLKAIALAGSNRFVLRSASRFFVHENEYDRAHDLLRRNEDTPFDPWLLSAEIALASLADRNSSLIPRAQQILKLKRFSPLQISELSAAVGTVEMLHGATKRAKKLFKQSLVDPTDNTVAQVRWAAQQLDLGFDDEHLQVQRSFEARAEEAHHRGGPAAQVIEHCLHWFEDEPFSIRPIMLGSYTSLARLRDFELGLKLIDAGLTLNPNDVALINNKVVALSRLGQLDEAEKALSRIRQRGPNFNLVIRATEGLVLFRQGNHDLGRACYAEAIQRAIELKDFERGARARAHLLEEEVRIGNFAIADDISRLSDDIQKSRNRHLMMFWSEMCESLRGTAFNVLARDPNADISSVIECEPLSSISGIQTLEKI